MSELAGGVRRRAKGDPADPQARPPGGQESVWQEVRGCRVYARRWRGPAARPGVLLVHGLGVSSRYMVPLARELAHEFNVYAPDLPGFGKSGRPAHTLSIEEHADALLAWMDAVGVEQAALLGNSLGCQILVETALLSPQRVDRLALVGPTVDRQARRPVRQILRLLQDAPRESWSLAAIVAWDYLTCGPLRLWRTLKFALQDRIEEKLPQIVQPTLILRGARDPLVPQAWAEEVARLAPHSRLAVIPQGAHAAHYTRAADVARIVRPFLTEAPHPRR